MLNASKSFRRKSWQTREYWPPVFSDSLLHHMRVGFGYAGSIREVRVASIVSGLVR
jgi:hypothetical protein